MYILKEKYKSVSIKIYLKYWKWNYTICRMAYFRIMYLHVYSILLDYKQWRINVFIILILKLAVLFKIPKSHIWVHFPYIYM